MLRLGFSREVDSNFRFLSLSAPFSFCLSVGSGYSFFVYCLHSFSFLIAFS
jgi:hypothetical protein